ncbi:MAG: periplasmic heavy metal sensor [Myxococcota bacterium]
MKFPKFRPIALTAGVVAGALALAGFADARPGHHRGGSGHGPQRMFFKAMERLDLTEAQEVELVRMRRALREEAKSVRSSMRDSHQTLLAEMKKPTPNREEIKAIVKSGAAQRAQMAERFIDRALDFHALLSADQKTKLVEMIEKRQARWERRHAE